MKFFYLFLFVFLWSCTPYAPPATDAYTQQYHPSQGYQQTQQPAQNYQQNQQSAPQQTTPQVTAPQTVYVYEDTDYGDRDYSQQTTGECATDGDCSSVCKDIFDSRSDKDDCEKLSISEVDNMKEFFKILEKPDEDDLVDLDYSALESIIDISFEPIKDLASKYTSSESKEILKWFVEDPDSANIIQDEEEDFEYLEAILENLDNDVVEALGVSIQGRDGFLDKVVETESTPLLEWVHDFLEEGSKNSKNRDCSGLSTCVFDKYCRLASKIDTQTRRDLIDFSVFENLMEELFDDVNSNLNTYDVNDYDEFCDSRYRSESTGQNPVENNRSGTRYSSYAGESCAQDFINDNNKPAGEREFADGTQEAHLENATSGNTELCAGTSATANSVTTYSCNTTNRELDIDHLKKAEIKNYNQPDAKFKFTFKSNEKTENIANIIIAADSTRPPYIYSPSSQRNGNRVIYSFKKDENNAIVPANKFNITVLYRNSNGKCKAL